MLINVHRKPFEVAPWEHPANFNNEWTKFRVGQCHGLWKSGDDAYEILSIINEEPGNGDFQMVLGWFEDSCRRDNKKLRIREILNSRFGESLVRKHGFRRDGRSDFVKEFC